MLLCEFSQNLCSCGNTAGVYVTKNHVGFSYIKVLISTRCLYHMNFDLYLIRIDE